MKREIEDAEFRGKVLETLKYLTKELEQLDEKIERCVEKYQNLELCNQNVKNKINILWKLFYVIITMFISTIIAEVLRWI